MTTPTDQPDWLKNHQPAPGPKQVPPSPTRRKGGFAPGTSGNPAGRKKGCKNKRTKILEEFEKAGSKVAAAAIAAALEGDVSAMSLVVQRLQPVLKARGTPVQFALDPESSLTAQAQSIMAAVSKGEIDPDTAKLLLDCVAALAGIRGTDELEQRLNDLEARLTKRT